MKNLFFIPALLGATLFFSQTTFAQNTVITQAIKLRSEKKPTEAEKLLLK